MADEASREALAAAFGPWGQMGTAWVEAISGLGGEAMRFLAERVREDVDLQHRLLHAGSFEEVRHIQATFVQTAIDQYTAETGRIVEFGEEMAAKLGLPRVD